MRRAQKRRRARGKSITCLTCPNLPPRRICEENPGKPEGEAMPTKLRPTPFQGGTPSLGPASRKPTKAGDNGSSRASSNDTGASGHHQPADGHGGEAAAHAPDRASLTSIENNSARQSFMSATMPLVIPDQVRVHLPASLLSLSHLPPWTPDCLLSDRVISRFFPLSGPLLISACTMA